MTILSNYWRRSTYHACYCNFRPHLVIVGNFSSITRQKGMGQVRSLCASLLQQVHHLSRTTIIIHCSSTATSHCYFCLESSYTSFIPHIALHFSIHVLMFGSATFLTPQYWVSQPNKHTQEPHHQRKFWDLFVTSSLPSTSTSVSATTLLPLLHLNHKRECLPSRTDADVQCQRGAWKYGNMGMCITTSLCWLLLL